MQLLARNVAQSKLKIENDNLVETNIRLRQYERVITERLNNVKDSYEPDKLQRLKEFETFCADIQAKQTKLLQELASIEKQVEAKKEIYYGLIAKNDAIDEKIYLMNEQEKKLKLREAFITDLEQKIHANVHQ